MANDNCNCGEMKIGENLLVIAQQAVIGNQRAAEMNIQASILASTSAVAKSFGFATAAAAQLPQQLGGLQTAAGTPGQGGA